MYSFSTTTTRVDDATTRVFPILSLSLSLSRIVPVASLSLSIYIYIYDTIYIYEELSLFAQTRFSKAANTNNEDVKCFPKTPRSFVLKLPFFREIFPQNSLSRNNTLIGKRRHATRRIEREREREREQMPPPEEEEEEEEKNNP